jgi:hypothetical protein
MHMPNITVRILDPEKTRVALVKVAKNLLVERFIEVLVGGLGLPLRRDGQELQYHLSIRDQEGNLERLDEGRALEAYDVREDDLLQLTEEIVAGSEGLADSGFDKMGPTPVYLLERIDRLEERIDQIENDLSSMAEALDSTTDIRAQVEEFESKMVDVAGALDIISKALSSKRR